MMRAARSQRLRKCSFESLAGNDLVEPDAGLHEHATTKMLKRRVSDKKRQRDHRKQQQRHAISAGQHAIVDLHGVKR